MSSRTIVTPPQRRRDHVPDSRSSESLPDLAELLGGGGDRRLKTGSRAVALPQNAAMGFQSTSTLLKYNLLSLQKEVEDEKKAATKATEKKEKSLEAKNAGKAKKTVKEKADVENPVKEKKQRAKPSEDRVKRPRKQVSRDAEGGTAFKQFAYADSGVVATAVDGNEKHSAEISVNETKKTAKEAEVKIKRPRKRKSDEAEGATALKQFAYAESGAAAIDVENVESHHGEVLVKEKKASMKKSEEKVKRPRKRKSDELEGSAASKHFANAESRDAAAKLENHEINGGAKGMSETKKPAKPRKRRKTDEDVLPDKAAKATAAKPATTRKQTTKSSTHFGAEAGKKKELISDAIVASDARPTEPRTNDENVVLPVKHVSPSKEVIKEADVYIIPSSSPAAFQTQPTPPRPNFAAFGYDDPKSNLVEPVRKAQKIAVPRPAKRIELIPDLAARSHNVTTGQPGQLSPVPAEEKLHGKELLLLQLPLPVPKESKKASPKKGPGGITGRVLARYAHVEPEAQDAVARLSPHFAVFDKTPKAVVEKPADPVKEVKKSTKPRKPRKSKDGTEKEPKKKAAGKVKIVPPPPPKLASPKQHEAKLKRQDLLFATSSQLRGGLSPELIRTMQVSLHETIPEVEEVEEAPSSPVAMTHTHAIRRRKGKLWAESAQEGDDTVFHRLSDLELPEELAPSVEAAVETLAQNALAASTNAFSPVTDQTPSGTLDEANAPLASYGFWLSHAGRDSPGPGIDPPTFNATAVTISSSPRLSVSPPRVALRPLSTNTKSATKAREGSKPDLDDKPLYIAPSSILERAVSQISRGRPRSEINSGKPASPAKPRGRPRKVSASSPGPQTPKKRGRPPKVRDIGLHGSPGKVPASEDPYAGFRDIDDIEDSEPDHTPSPRRKRGSPPGSQPLPLTTNDEAKVVAKRVNTDIVNASHPRWLEVKAKLFPEITTTVRSAPTTHSVKHPSWYEKMLLYDPIVLEDLTAWLNEQGLRVEGKDRVLVEVSPWMTQSWCEMNSICCLWKEGLRGGVRVRY